MPFPTSASNEPIAFMRNELGVLIGMVQYMVPYAVLPLLANMQGLDRRVMEASRSLGASRPRPSCACTCR
jgi:putative spermidine/putrescine transport system permease protein